MAELILEHSTLVKSPEGKPFVARTYGEERPDGTWVGWIEFTPVGDHGPTRVTDRETSQPNKVALDYWATGLEPIYFEGALERAQPVSTK
jgi:hypothetical protein